MTLKSVRKMERGVSMAKTNKTTSGLETADLRRFRHACRRVGGGLPCCGKVLGKLDRDRRPDRRFIHDPRCDDLVASAPFILPGREGAFSSTRYGRTRRRFSAGMVRTKEKKPHVSRKRTT